MAQIFNNILRRQIGTRTPTVEYICTQQNILFMLLKGYVQCDKVYILSSKEKEKLFGWGRITRLVNGKIFSVVLAHFCVALAYTALLTS